MNSGFLSLPPLRRILTWCVVGVAVLLVYDLAERWVRGPDLGIVSVAGRARPVPAPAPESKVIHEVERVYIDRPVEVVKEVPARVERDFHLDLDRVAGEDLLTVADLPKMPHGGRAAVTLDREGHATVTTLPNRAPLFDLGGAWEVGGGPMWSTGRGVGVRLQVTKELARVGPVYMHGQAELDLGASGAEGRAMLLAVVKF